MKLSLQEQLLKSGLVSTAQARTIKADKRKQTQQQRHNKVEVVDEAKELAQKAQAEKVERDKELNQQRQQQEEQKQLAAQIKQIIELNRLPLAEDGEAYHFTDHNKVKRLYVSEAMRSQIVEGQVAIVRNGQQYHAVLSEVARKIQERAPSSVIVFNEPNKVAEAADDPYAAYQVPDDLIW
jgi:uncharacterized protein YaiL (DUF2058 family)